MLSTMLIDKTFDDYYQNQENLNQNTQPKKNTNANASTNTNMCQNYGDALIEYVDDINYNIQTNEIKYKIFKDISSINVKNDNLELILNLPVAHNVISINKIKLSKDINKFLKDIYLVIDNHIVITKDEIFGSKEHFLKIIAYKFNESVVNCLMDKNVDICIILHKDALNHVMNKNIFVNYSFAISKNKIKFL